ncbi:GDSL-type esterase/lipase family protein [Bacillaceae bacterium]
MENMDNKVYYVALGDSLTEGIGASKPERSFPARFFQAIRQTDACRYVNHGKAGRSSGELLQYLREPRVRMELQRANCVTITTGGIDMLRAYERGASLAGYMRAIQTLRDNLEHILELVRKFNPQTPVLLLGLYNPGSPRHGLFHFATGLLRKINRMYERTARVFGAGTVDPLPSFLNKPHLLADEVHPNDLGYKILSDLFVQKMQEFMAKVSGEQPEAILQGKFTD